MATRKQVYEKFGGAAEAAQLFETASGTALLCAEGLNNGWHKKVDHETAARVLKEIESITLGVILRRFKKLIQIENSGIPEQFGRALKARNRLFHGFFEHHNLWIETPDGCEMMIEDLTALHLELDRSHGVAAGIADALTKSFVEWRDAQSE